MQGRRVECLVLNMESIVDVNSPMLHLETDDLGLQASLQQCLRAPRKLTRLICNFQLDRVQDVVRFLGNSRLAIHYPFLKKVMAWNDALKLDARL